MQIITDLDFLVYRAGFAAETRHYDVVVETPSGEIVEKLFSPKSSCAEYPDGASAGDCMKQWIKELPEGSVVLSKDARTTAEPVGHALHIAKEMLHNMIAAVRKEHKACRKSRPRLLLTGSRNYRYHIATIRPYKGNRDADTRPTHYQAIRDYLINDHGAEVIEGHEADDEASIAMWAAKPGKAILISQDKDLDQAPGLHFDPVKKVFYEVSHEDAERAFWVQVLSGDTTDNIPGCYKIGRTKAEKIVDSPNGHLWGAVIDTYSESIHKHGKEACGYSNAYSAALETAQLVRMQRYPYELWVPPGEPRASTEHLEELDHNDAIRSRTDNCTAVIDTAGAM